VVAAPQSLERENDLLVPIIVARLAKFLHLVGKRAGSRKMLATGANGVRLIAGTDGKRIDAVLEPVGRPSRSGVRRLTASEQNDCQP
jgi:hypothetical protein